MKKDRPQKQACKKTTWIIGLIVLAVAGVIGFILLKEKRISLPTKIQNADQFLSSLPSEDAIFSQIQADFSILIESEPFQIDLSSPTSGEIEQASSMVIYQALRTAYYMDPGIPHYLPWTNLSLYEWLNTSVDGINLRREAGKNSCCGMIDGKKYLSLSIADHLQSADLHSWPDVSRVLRLIAHEARHANEETPSHVKGCMMFPNEVNSYGCDSEYDTDLLGSYGVEYWLEQSWLTGYLNVGLSCNSETAEEYMNIHLGRIRSLRRRFVEDMPVLVHRPDPPYGGPCYSSKEPLGPYVNPLFFWPH